jgi:ArsR family transcriptional regulator, lead/cadmium/zinc/bismuth-responsive transcriptional repressor
MTLMTQNLPFPDHDSDACGVSCIHPHAIRITRARMPEDRLLTDLSDFYKLFGDATRLKILAALSVAELCVCDIGVLLDMKQPAVSHQLRILKQARIVRPRREGKIVYYALADDHIRHVLRVGMEHLGEKFETVETP